MGRGRYDPSTRWDSQGRVIYSSDRRRERWELSEPLMGGWQVFHMSADLRERTPRFYAGGKHDVWGRSIARSTDLGKTWDNRTEGLGFPQDLGTNRRIGEAVGGRVSAVHEDIGAVEAALAALRTDGPIR